jgi:hypothetical protein
MTRRELLALSVSPLVIGLGALERDDTPTVQWYLDRDQVSPKGTYVLRRKTT